jgi:hypothetical protein
MRTRLTVVATLCPGMGRSGHAGDHDVRTNQVWISLP